MPHTPGPWKAVAGGEVWDNVGNYVTRMSAHAKSEKEMLANAALISAAPELLEALKFWVAMENSSNVSKDRFDAVMKAATEAIAKAEGK